jgi:hypothetical protein
MLTIEEDGYGAIYSPHKVGVVLDLIWQEEDAKILAAKVKEAEKLQKVLDKKKEKHRREENKIQRVIAKEIHDEKVYDKKAAHEEEIKEAKTAREAQQQLAGKSRARKLYTLKKAASQPQELAVTLHEKEGEASKPSGRSQHTRKLPKAL